ncbi:MAG: lytic murein transglycosylase [Rhodobacteraceae bacterium]|nr:lytic murein transglycosylase [Paracoccaceae bacterium]
MMNSGFDAWLAGFCERAKAAGIDADVIQDFRSRAAPIREVIERADSQPEFTLSAAAYVGRLVTEERVAAGKSATALQRATLSKSPVEAEIITAIWGVESDFGRKRGEFPTLNTLASLAWYDRRAEFWESELFAALRIIQSGAVDADRLVGSWAGAMGHTQFLPSTFLSDAAGADLWSDDPVDALLSTARFLNRRGWKTRLPWGSEAILPKDFDYRLSGHWQQRSAEFWNSIGLALPHAEDFSAWQQCSLYLPTGHRGPAFLITANFRVLLHYNRSPAYALAVGLLADRLRGGEAPISWPQPEPVLSPTEIRELQRYLVRLGYDTGGVDGIAGAATLRSIQLAQADLGGIPDGFPDRSLLLHLSR